MTTYISLRDNFSGAQAATCGTCQYFKSDNTCHLHPPLVANSTTTTNPNTVQTSTTVVWAWPTVASTDFCGDFRPIVSP